MHILDDGKGVFLLPKKKTTMETKQKYFLSVFQGRYITAVILDLQGRGKHN